MEQFLRNYAILRKMVTYFDFDAGRKIVSKEVGTGITQDQKSKWE